MGLLDGAAPNVEETESQADETPVETTTEAAPAADVIVAAPKPSRRAQAAAELAELKTMVGDINKNFSEFRSAKEQELAQLRGEITAYTQRPPQVVYQQPPQQQGPDPAQLRRDAMQALDNKDFNRYQELSHEAAVLDAERRVLSRMPQQQPQQGNPQLDRMLIPLWSAFPDVAKHPRAGALLNAKANELLDGRGMQPGPETLSLVFEEVNAAIQGSKKGQPQGFSKAAAAAITGTPTNRTVAAPASESTVNLSEIARRHGVKVETMKTWAAKAGMTLEEYAAGLPQR